MFLLRSMPNLHTSAHSSFSTVTLVLLMLFTWYAGSNSKTRELNSPLQGNYGVETVALSTSFILDIYHDSNLRALNTKIERYQLIRFLTSVDLVARLVPLFFHRLRLL